MNASILIVGLLVTVALIALVIGLSRSAVQGGRRRVRHGDGGSAGIWAGGGWGGDGGGSCGDGGGGGGGGGDGGGGGSC